MRKRRIQILFRLNESEAEQLNDLVKRSGRSREAFLRAMIKGYRLCEKPDPEFYRIMRTISGIGNRINQLAVKANTTHFIDAQAFFAEARNWKRFQMDLRRKYLLPQKENVNGRL